MIEVNGLTKVFNIKTNNKKFNFFHMLNKKEAEEKKALDNVSFILKDGETLGLIGKNGSGKSTLIKILATLYEKTSGSVKVDNEEISENKLKIRKKLGVLFGGDAGLYNRMTAYENIEYFGLLNGINHEEIKSRIDKLSTYFDMNSYLHRKVDNFSRGMKQKVCFLRSIIHNPDIIILDEPSTGLDVESISKVSEFIKYNQEHKKTVIISSHNMDEINNLCDNILILKDGKQSFYGLKKEIIKNKDFGKLYELMGVGYEKYI